jgi:DNA-binding NtrC family response regulator
MVREAAMPRPKTVEFLGTPAVFASDAINKIDRLAERVGRTNAAVLITGESGCGKEVVARAIHHYSPRHAKPWVDVNCNAIPEHLLESELFGFEKGAFSGADTAKPGLFELADGGTLFLDEIGDLAPRIQVKLLRVLDGVPYYRLGGVKKVTVDVRIVTATNHDLQAAVDRGDFRTDLFHRLSQIVVDVPPLRERIDDIEPLALHFLAGQNPELRLSDEALECLRHYPWPGNVRELRNVVVHAAVFANGPTITCAELPARIVPANFEVSLRRLAGLDRLERMERNAILVALRDHNGHQQSAASQLGISKRTLQRRLKLYHVEQAGNPNLTESV